MKLYHISGIYPDINFNWNLTPERLGFSDVDHSHNITDVLEITTLLNTKADSNHSHTNFMSEIKVDSVSLAESIELSTVNLTMNTTSGIEFDLNLTTSGDVIGIKNVNPNRQHTTICYQMTDFKILDDSLSLMFIPEISN